MYKRQEQYDPQPAPQYEPINIFGAQLEVSYDSVEQDDAAGAVATLVDQSGNGNDATAAVTNLTAQTGGGALKEWTGAGTHPFDLTTPVGQAAQDELNIWFVKDQAAIGQTYALWSESPDLRITTLAGTNGTRYVTSEGNKNMNVVLNTAVYQVFR